jgi:hypothetical protein
MRGNRIIWALVSVVALLLISGVAGRVLFPYQWSGWFAYAPLSHSVFVGGMEAFYPLTQPRLLALTTIVAALVLGAGLIGWVLGRRNRGTES